ncbi:ankyrin repeat and zinc finger domain-containing protein 1 [Asbolus verrucosus]|uniref:Ankyrin repeat and zinc finger domain-containing protein 1 n=1 Tax=Asbolus verrucosus TaxID=1661398 RepID=A0A482VQS2_ASBVE|nr:ankyrin repeat and zinc finger domain-containing protein 1 [Asbolus verrucosus]
MLRQKLSEKYAYSPYQSTPRLTQHNLKSEQPTISEWKLGIIGLFVSLIVITGKLYFANLDYIKQLVLEHRLVSYEVITEDGEVMFKVAWKDAVKYSNVWLPALCGVLTTYFTWIMVYLDSQVPGVQPPSPFSPSKYKARSGHSFHLNYVFAVLMGVLAEPQVEMEVLKIFEEKFHLVIRDKIQSVLLEGNESGDTEESPKREWAANKTNSLACSYCQIQFDHVTQQREHYKLDWHRYNLRQSLLQKPPIGEEEFVEKTAKDDISSISGSDSEKEDTLDAYATAQGKIFLQNSEGKVFSMYACLLCNKKEELRDDVVANRLRECCVNNKQWTVLMLGGGHFAGAIFKGDDAILHKTFHCYTVRAGQGGAQSSRDNKSGGTHPKSAGASLRRYNEQALVQHVRGIIEAWKSELDRCSLIIYRASGPHNRSVLFGGGAPLLDRTDSRLRTIPFSTRRATFAEVKRVHSVITLAHVYGEVLAFLKCIFVKMMLLGSLESAVEHFTRHKLPEQNTKRSKARSSCIDRAKSREIVERPLPMTQEDSSSDNDIELSTENQDVSFEESLQEFGDTLTPEQRKQRIKKKKPKKSRSKKLKEQEEYRKNELIEVLRRGNVNKLGELLENHLKIEENQLRDGFVNEVLDDKGNTLLHIAAMNEQTDTLEFLLKNDANPCAKNQKQQTPYTSTQSKEIREALKQFARDNPDKYNYNKAQIQTNVLSPEEANEKKKAQRKIKKEKEKIKRKENEIKKQEESEKERFLKLSDREKRALAAERRILSQSGAVIARCFLCAADITGKVPFEYLGNRFCSVDCLKAHRMQNPVVLS